MLRYNKVEHGFFILGGFCPWSQTQQTFSCPHSHHCPAGSIRHVALAERSVFHPACIDRDAEKKEQENAEYSSDFRPQDTGAGQPARDTEPVYGHDVPTAEQQNAKKRHKTLTSLCTVFGGIFLVVGLAGLADIIDMWGYWFDWGEFLTALAQTIGGGAALAMGLRMKQARKLERQLDKIVGTRDNIPLDELFAAAGIDADRGRAAVERAIDHGYFGADAISTTDRHAGVRGAAPSRPDPPSPHPHRLPRISMPPCSASSGRPTMPSPTR